MNYPWKNMSPKDGFLVRQNAQLSDVDRKILTFLYQPLIGSNAYSLYMTLWTEVGEETYWSNGILHSELLTLLNIGIPELYQARIKLEAIGLLKSYLKSSQSDKIYIYELLSPQSSATFFRDDLLSLLLLETVGSRKFKNLRNRFTISSFDKEHYEEITKSFLDVYRFDANLLKRESETLKESLELVGENIPDGPVLDSQTFDFKFFYAGLNKHYINRSAITKELESAILVLHTMYGINELDMQQYVLEASDIDTGSVDERKLKNIVYRQYHDVKQDKVKLEDIVEIDIQADKKQQKNRLAYLRQEGLTDSEINLVEASEEISPFDFMTSIKKQKGGYVTKNEEWTLQEILTKANLPTSVINILIHYILAIRDNPIFEKSLAYKISNDWAQNKVVSPEKALQKVKTMYQENAEKIEQAQKKQYSRYPSSNYGNNNKIRTETLPEWAKDGNVEKIEKPMSEIEKQAFMDRLKKIQSFGKEGE
ncbi:replication initiation and membrane attachment family protein [Carnobacterium sp.]|uniref:replication initiation and membrane attachment family protein n=1 Tax=Carnobacterium sp. TaxID=48221 RepID=UPI003C735B53